MSLKVSTHPLLGQWLLRLRDKATSAEDFRDALHHAGLCLGFELFATYPTESVEVETVFCKTRVESITTPITLIPILRAGLGLESAALSLVPQARVEHVGLFRHPETREAISYYSRLSPSFEGRRVVILDPLVATANTLVAVLQQLEQRGVKSVDVMALLVSQHAAQRLESLFPWARIVCASIEPEMNEHSYLVPGLGDAGDRLYDTVH